MARRRAVAIRSRCAGSHSRSSAAVNRGAGILKHPFRLGVAALIALFSFLSPAPRAQEPPASPPNTASPLPTTGQRPAALELVPSRPLFATPKLLTGSSPQDAALADFNGDGRLDILTANIGSDDVAVLLGDGAGGFANAVRYPAGESPSSLAIGDCDDDGQSDVVVVGLTGVGSNTELRFLKGGPGGTLAAPVALGLGGN